MTIYVSCLWQKTSKNICLLSCSKCQTCYWPTMRITFRFNMLWILNIYRNLDDGQLPNKQKCVPSASLIFPLLPRISTHLPSSNVATYPPQLIFLTSVYKVSKGYNNSLTFVLTSCYKMFLHWEYAICIYGNSVRFAST